MTASSPDDREPSSPSVGWMASIDRNHLPGAAFSLAAAMFWVVLAMRSPTSTHHFAPLVVGAIWGSLYRLEVPAPPGAVRVLIGVAGCSVALTAFFYLLAIGRLDGPPLISAVPVVVELPALAVIGGLIGAGVHRYRRWGADADRAAGASTDPGTEDGAGPAAGP
ncbi:MAG: hypothetical protein AAF547_11540 [Actinomycetota bacterium]